MSQTDSASPINTIIIKIILHTYLVEKMDVWLAVIFVERGLFLPQAQHSIWADSRGALSRLTRGVEPTQIECWACSPRELSLLAVRVESGQNERWVWRLKKWIWKVLRDCWLVEIHVHSVFVHLFHLCAICLQSVSKRREYACNMKEESKLW